MNYLLSIPLSVLFLIVLCTCHDSKSQDESLNAEFLQHSFVWLDSAIPGEQAYVVFRKEFDIEKTIKNAELRIFADTRYLLWINGQYVERGPCRFDPKYPEYDILPVDEYLVKGKNAIAVLVHHYAISSFKKWHDKNARMMSHNPGLTTLLTIFSEDGEMLSVTTDTTWKATKNNRFMNSPGSYSSIPDNIDARLDQGDWTQSSFDDSDWKNASVVNGDDWGKLSPRSIPLLKEQTIIPTKICQEIIDGEINNEPQLFSKSLPLKMKNGTQIVIDAGEMVQAYSILDFDAEEGCKMEIGYASLFFQNNKKPFAYTPYSRYIAKKGAQRYMSTDTYGFRYLVVKILEGELTLKRIKLVDRRYPNRRKGSFSCNDSLLNKLWKVCVNTVEVCSEDAFVDCADRERAQWMADGYKMNYPVSRVTLATIQSDSSLKYSDSRLIKNMLRHMALSQLPDGRLQPMRPSDYKAELKHGVIDDYSCLWIQALREYSDRTNDNDFIQEMWPYAKKAIDYFLQRTTSSGLIHAGEFIYFDNPLRYVKCEGATINAFIYGSLRDMSYLAGKTGNDREQTRFTLAANELYNNFNEYLRNPEGENYYAAIISKEPATIIDNPPSYSEPYKGELINGKYAPPTAHAALMALSYNLVPEDKKQKVFNYMLKCSEEEQIWWPYTSRFYLDLLYAQDEPEMNRKALDYIRNSFGHMIDYETGTTSEDWNSGSFVHESGSHPAYFMSAYVLGVRTQISEKGLQLVIQPRLGDLIKAEGRVLCEFGEVPVKWEKSDSKKLKFDFIIPDKTDALVYLPAINKTIPAGLSINGELYIKDGKSLGKGKMTGNYYFIQLSEGTYSGEALY